MNEKTGRQPLPVSVQERCDFMVELKKIVKRYPGAERNAVENVSLRIESGEFFGLLGPNGAGKTTLMGVISTLMLPTQGEVLLDDIQLHRGNHAGKRKLSLVTQHYSLRNDMTVWQIMELQSRLYGIPKKEWVPQAKDLLSFCGLTDETAKTVRKLSGGMKRKLMLARALLTEPSFLILDEPTVGLDPTSRRQIWDLLRALNQRGLTVLLTTHYMDEAQILCDRIAIINQGEITRVDFPESMITALGVYAVDVFDGKCTRCQYFTEKERALSFVALSPHRSVLRNTTLEDVFLDETGCSLGGSI